MSCNPSKTSSLILFFILHPMFVLFMICNRPIKFFLYFFNNFIQFHLSLTENRSIMRPFFILSFKFGNSVSIRFYLRCHLFVFSTECGSFIIRMFNITLHFMDWNSVSVFGPTSEDTNFMMVIGNVFVIPSETT